MDIIEETLVQQCVFCIKTSEECELIDMSVSSIVLGSEILDFDDIIRNILELKLVQDQETSICEECKNTLIQFHVFKSNARNKSNLWEDENLQKVKMYLDENDNCNETISCVRYNKCLVLVPESKKSFVQMFQLWQPQVVIEKILEMPLPSNDAVGTRTKKPKIEEIKLKEERIVGKNIIEENTIEIEVIDQFNKLDETDTDIAAPSISISEEEWLQQQYADSEMVENEDGEEIESWVCSHCSLAERFLNVNEYRSHLLAAHLGYEPEIFGDKEPDSDDLMTEDDVIAYDDSMNSTDVEVKHRELVVNDLFECAHCNFTFTNRVDYRIHQKEHVDKKTFQTSRFERLFCVDCRYQFTTQAHFQAHMNGHQLYAIVAKHSTYPICDVCNVMFCDDSSANLHQERHELGTLIDEEILSEGLFLRYGHHRAEWEQPDKELLLENALKCGHCPKRFADEESCRLHQLIFHIIILKCPVESRVFNGNQAFSIHLKNNHPELFGDEHKFACSVCKKEFATIFEKLKHMKVCDKKKYQCNHCEKRFSQKCYLMTHLRQVNGQANVVCEHCNKVCRDKGDYQIHLRSHSDVKPFHCSICPKAYKTSSARAAHLETHQESGFDCMYCATKFKSRRTLQKHCKVKHKAGSEKTVESIAAENPNKYVIEEVDIVE